MTEAPLPVELEEALADLGDERSAPLRRTWSNLDHAFPESAYPPADEALSVLRRRIDVSAPATRHRRDRPAWRPGRAVLALAFATLLVAVVGGSWWFQRSLSVLAPHGEIIEHALPDGSLAVLAPGSEIRYRRAFGDVFARRAPARTIRMQGEVFFEVVADPRPLIVETHDAVVEVLGTAFSVRARPGDVSSATRVEVERGSVRLTSPAGRGDGVVLAAGESGGIAATGAPAAETTAVDVAVWRRGGFAIHELPLADVLREIERRFDVTVIAGRDLPYHTRLTLFYRRSVDVENLLHDVALAAGLEYRPVQGGFEVSQPTPADS